MLARVIARRCGIPVIPALKRVRPTLAQAGLSNTGRRQNVAAAFRPRRAPWCQAVEGKRILLIDDVMTTGSTAAACAFPPTAPRPGPRFDTEPAAAAGAAVPDARGFVEDI